jgi:DNA modification methylase
MNRLYYGDNLDVLRQYVRDESVDLVYLDPPFNSNATYNVLFAEQDGTEAAGQIKAFEDTWHWDQAAAAMYEDVVSSGSKVGDAMEAFHKLLGPSNMLAYLAMMAPRLIELHRALKPTGSLYLHCDPTASHYLKLLLDAIFGPTNFLSEIVWKRSHAHNGARKYGPVHDVILFYGRSERYAWNQVHQPLPESTIRDWYNNVEEATGRRYNRADLTAAGTRTGDSGRPWRGIDVTAKGRHWAVPGFVREIVGDLPVPTLEALDRLDALGRIHWPKRDGGTPMLKRYLEEATGAAAQDVITDIDQLHNKAAERLGYPTQKPEALLDRLLQASSNEGEIVLDPFCGCGTTIASAQRLNRRWIGIDITNLAISLIRARLRDQYGEAIRQQYDVIGEPETLQDARVLAADDPYQFQWWALGQVGARPAEQKKGADRGIDGRIVFFDDNTRNAKTIILSVKAGGVQASHVRDLVGVLDREKAVIGVLISLEEPTRNMRQEAAEAGFYRSEWGQHPRVQLLTIGQIFEGKQIDMPPRRQVDATLKRAPKAAARVAQQAGMFEGIGLDDAEVGQ